MIVTKTKRLYFSGLILGAAFLGLSACGGGGSNSGGGDGSKTYTGSENLTLSATGVPSENIGAFSLRIEITGNVVLVTNSDGATFNGTLANDTFTATGNTIGFSQDGISCAASKLTYMGTVAGGTITGSTRGVVNCSSGSINIPITQTGNFSVSLVAKQLVDALVSKSKALVNFAANK